MQEIKLDSVKRIAEIFHYLTEHAYPVGVSELSRELNYNKSVVHRLLKALEAHDFLVFDCDTRRYQLGTRILQLGLVALERLDIRTLARPRIERMWSISRETVVLNMRADDCRLHVDGMESALEVKLGLQLGDKSPLYLGASGKAILAFMPDKDQNRILASIKKGEKTADGKMIVVDDLKADFKTIRERGYAISASERRPGAFGVSAPIINHLGDVIGSLSLGGPTSRWQDGTAEKWGVLVRSEAQGLSKDLGYGYK